MIELIDQLIAQIDRGHSPAVHDAPAQYQPLLGRLCGGAIPREALLNLSRVAKALHDQPLLRWRWPMHGAALDALATVLSSGPELAGLIARKPARLRLLTDPTLGQPWGRDRLVSELARRLPSPQEVKADPELDLERVGRQVAAFRNDHFVRLAACEFGASTLEQVGRELAHLADACLQGAIEVALALHSSKYGGATEGLQPDGPPATLAAIGMGKYGAEELNFCSDIDLVFIYSADEGHAGPTRSLHEFFTAVCQDVTRVVGHQGSEGFAFRVDLRLRPEGSRGPICNALASAERYYETWGGPYDRLAWLKARPCAGDLALGQGMVELMRPFVFSRHAGAQIVEQIHQLSRRIRAELGTQTTLVPGWNVKLGSGGIRDIEFFVQALQLLHGGRHRRLQERATLRALDKLLFAGLISEGEHTALAESYELFRRIEHRLQLHSGRQTHLLPAEGALRDHVAAHMGYQAPAFAAELSRRRAWVANIYATLGDAPAPESSLACLLQPNGPHDAHTELLRQAGFHNPAWASDQIAMLTDKPWGPFAHDASPRMAQLAERLLTEIARSPDPDAALRHIVALVLKFGPYQGPWVMLAENEAITRLLCNLFGTSEFMARLLVDNLELLDQLIVAGRAEPVRDDRSMGQALDHRLAQQADIEQRFGVLEQFRNEEMLRIGLHDIAGDLELEMVWAQLSDLAEQLLGRLHAMVCAETTRPYGHPVDAQGQPGRMVVVGLGKLGGREMSYGSDLDLIFIHSGEGHTVDGPHGIGAAEFYAKVAQRLIRALTTPFVYGALYQVDARLRPSGSQGTLVSSLAAFQQYHRHAQVWERQVLTKARVVCGDAAFGQQVQNWIDEYVYGPPPDPAYLRTELVRLRERIQRELAQEDSNFCNLKLGRGGLLDVEFIAQYFQLCFGADQPALRTRSTIEALLQARSAGLLDNADAHALLAGYRFLRRLEGRLRIVRGRSAERLSRAPDQVEVVARRLGLRSRTGHSAGTQLLQAYRDHTETVRAAYRRVLAL